eukprot:67205-Pyramimonas_sp.AAC.1
MPLLTHRSAVAGREFVAVDVQHAEVELATDVNENKPRCPPWNDLCEGSQRSLARRTVQFDLVAQDERASGASDGGVRDAGVEGEVLVLRGARGCP